MVEEKVERIYTVPLGKAYNYLRTRRAPRAVKLLREFLARHMKVGIANVRLSNSLNTYLWEHSIQRPPRKAKVRVMKIAGNVKAYLPDEVTDEEKKAKKEKELNEAADKLKKEKEEKEKKEAQMKKAEEKAAKEANAPKIEGKPSQGKEEHRNETKVEKKEAHGEVKMK